jgi:UDP-glucose 4-epimerase
VKWGALGFGDIAEMARLTEFCKEYRLLAIMHLAAYALIGEPMLARSQY